MKRPQIWDKFTAWFMKQYGNEGGTMLIHLGALSWLLAAVAQVVSLACNREINADEKKFLFPQEIADGVTNFSMFYLLTLSVQKAYKFCIERGVVIQKDIKDCLKKKYGDNLKDLLKNHEISSLLKDDKDNLAKFMKFKEGGDIFTTIIASILAVNVITPIIRNKIASFFHNNSLEKEKEKQNQEKQETFKTKNVKNLDIKEGVNEINSKPSFENLNKQLVTPLNQKKQNPFENGSLQSTFATNSLWS